MKQFLTMTEAAEEIGVCTATVKKMVEGIRNKIPERYSRTDLFEGKKTAVRFAALQDYAEIQTYEDLGITPPPYDPIRREMELGIIPVDDMDLNPAISEDRLANLVADKLIQKILKAISL